MKLKKKIIYQFIFMMVASALMLAISIGKTFSWYHSATNANLAEFSPVTVELVCSSDVAPIFIDFEENSIESKEALVQSLIEMSSGNNMFSEWLKDSSTSTSAFLEEISDIKATQTSLVSFKYTFSNTSDIPVYFKISKPDFMVGNESLQNVAISAWIVEEEQKDATLQNCTSENAFKDGQDGYFYYPEPINANKTFDVVFGACVLPGIVDTSTDVDVVFSIKEAVIIQASGNAVFLSEDWANAAIKGIFKEYNP